jgi:DNA-binding XRE family transcriptional regulator
MGALKMNDRQRWAQDLICKQGHTQKEAAEIVGVTPITMNKWFKKFNWESLRRSMLATRTAQLERLYMQLDELNTHIMNREAGKRFADPKEADTISKLTTSIQRLETDASISDIVEVAKRLGDWMRSQNHPDTLHVVNICNDFIKDLLKR